MRLSLIIALVILFGSEASHANQWQLVRNDDAREIRAYLRDVQGSQYKSFYVTTHVKASLASIVSVLSDVPAMPEWIARMRSARALRREVNREIWVHCVYKLPYPFLEREAVLHSTLTQGKKNVVEVTTRAVGGYISNHPKRVRLMNMYSIWRLTPEKNGVIKVELWGQGDPGGYVPPLLFNYNLPDEPVQTLRNLRQMLTREKYRDKRLEYIQEP